MIHKYVKADKRTEGVVQKKAVSKSSAILSGGIKNPHGMSSQYENPRSSLLGDVRIHYSSGRTTDAPCRIGSYSEATVQRCKAPRRKNGKPVRTYQTYTKTNPETGRVYSGRTSGTGTPQENVARRDGSHHMNGSGYGPAVLDTTTTSRAANRGREQQLIESHGGAQSTGGTSGNAINGISQRNPRRRSYMEAAKEEFGEIG